MRFSSCCTSISPSTRPTSNSSRSPMSVISSRRCLSARRTPMWAAMVSARRPGSSMPAKVCSSSGGSLRLVLTYCSNSDISDRAIASTSRGSRASLASISVPCPCNAPSCSTTLSTVTRDRPSTSTLMVPSGSLSSCSTCARVPTVYRSPAAGSSVSADFCATSRMRLSASIAFSSARIDLSRPTNSGITMCGNTTTSRSGNTGRSRISGWDWAMGHSAGMGVFGAVKSRWPRYGAIGEVLQVAFGKRLSASEAEAWRGGQRTQSPDAALAGAGCAW